MDLTFLLPAIAGAIGVAILMSTVSKTAIRKDGISILKYGIGLKIFAFIAFILSVLLSYVAAQAKADQLFPAIALVLFFYSASIGGLLEFLFVKISYDSEKIYTRSPWKKPREFFWKDIVSLSYSTPFTWHIMALPTLQWVSSYYNNTITS